MVTVIITALYFFLPSYLANAAPVLLARYKLFEFLNLRADFGVDLNNEPLFGTTKSIRGIIGGIITAMVVVALQSLLYHFGIFREISITDYAMPNVLLLGFLFGFGEGFGDLIKSFFKRRMHIKSTAPSIPLDQSSFLLSLVLCFLYIFPGWDIIFAILVISPLIPIGANFIGYKLGWKAVWW